MSDVSKEESTDIKSKLNREEAKLTRTLFELISELGEGIKRMKGVVGVISPYKSQVSKVSRVCHDFLRQQMRQ
jgi:superfamily I DNA and/or RNA helicase